MRSQNGYPANNRSLVSARLIPGTAVQVTVRNGPAGDLLLYVAGRWDREVEDVDNVRGALDDWGYAERPIRGSDSELSNHASGTALDLNATRHPLAQDPALSFTPNQRAQVRRILADCRGAVRWGGDYRGRKDGMHIEVVADEARCAQVLAAVPRETPVSATMLPDLKFGDTGLKVESLQGFSNAYPWTPAIERLLIDGRYGNATVRAVAEAQAQMGILGPDANGRVIGPRTKAGYWSRGWRG